MEHFFLALANTEDLEKILSENEVTPSDTDDFLYFKWSPNEWLCMSYDLEDSQLKAFNKKLREEVSAIKSDCDNYRKTMLEVCVAALVKAKPQIENSLKHSNLPIFVSFTDISKLQKLRTTPLYKSIPKKCMRLSVLVLPNWIGEKTWVCMLLSKEH